jgi:hypothetical protein
LRVLVVVGIQLSGCLQEERDDQYPESALEHLATYLLNDIRVRSQSVLEQSMQTLIKVGL